MSSVANNPNAVEAKAGEGQGWKISQVIMPGDSLDHLIDGDGGDFPTFVIDAGEHEGAILVFDSAERAHQVRAVPLLLSVVEELDRVLTGADPDTFNLIVRLSPNLAGAARFALRAALVPADVASPAEGRVS